MVAMSVSYKPGDVIACTVKRLPKATDRQQTIVRLMRRDPAAIRALRRAQLKRRQNQVVYNRGNRDWFMRRPTARITSLTTGANWKMLFNLDLAADLASVAEFVDVKKA
jgi:hypothetical protein